MADEKQTPLFDFVFIKDYFGDRNIVGYLDTDGGVDLKNPKYILADGDLYTRKQLILGGAQGGEAVFISSKQMEKILTYLDENGQLKPNE